MSNNKLYICVRMSYSISPKQSSSSSGNASQEYIKIVEQLVDSPLTKIDSDDEEVLAKRMMDLHPSFPVLKRITPLLTNHDKINLFLRDSNFKVKLTDKLKEHNALLFDPFVKLQLYTIRHQLQIGEQFDQQDLFSICSRFGQVLHLVLNKATAYARFDNYISCFLLIKSLNGFEASDVLRISASWCLEEDFQAMKQFLPTPLQDDESKKQMGRFDIYLQPNNEFKISKRIIGPKGNNMKKILTETSAKSKMPHLPIESIAKIRLRGKGSGFLEGESNLESDETLNLCVSSKSSSIFHNLCDQIQKLLFKLSVDYKDYYYKTHKKSCEGIAYRRYELRKNTFELVKQVNLEQIGSSYDLIAPLPSKKQKLSEGEICELIRKRDKARKQGKYKQADTIREQLKREGVVVIDGKHTSSTMCKTTWKYLEP